jgi:hypothetical protein
VQELPRTNNELEQLFGSYRYHERRTTGRKATSPATVLRGAVRLLAATVTRGYLVTASEFARANRQRWQELRAQLENRRVPGCSARDSGGTQNSTSSTWSSWPHSWFCCPSFFVSTLMTGSPAAKNACFCCSMWRNCSSRCAGEDLASLRRALTLGE